jgi:hypothetical protein
MENKTLSRALFGVTVVLFIITFYFFFGMMTNGKPKDYDPQQMGLEMISKDQANEGNYIELGQAAYDAKLKQIDNHILTGVNYMGIILLIAGAIMIIFLVWGLISTLMIDFKKGVPSLIFSGIAILAFIFAFAMQGDESLDSDMQKANFWAYGLFFVLVPGAAILVIDLVIGIIRGYTK